MSSQVPKPGPGVPLLSLRGIWLHVLETRMGFEEDTVKEGPALSPSFSFQSAHRYLLPHVPPASLSRALSREPEFKPATS